MSQTTSFLQKEVAVGIGSGTTVVFAAAHLGQKAKEANVIVKCVPTSFQAQELIRNNGLVLSTLDETPMLDVTVDGADECDKKLNCIKGGGGCLTQEKIVAYFSKKMVVAADYSKCSDKLGTKWTNGLPIEVMPICWGPVKTRIVEQFGGEAALRLAVKKMVCFHFRFDYHSMEMLKKGPVVTDNGNFLLDWKFPMENDFDWDSMSIRLKMIPGSHPLFTIHCNSLRKLGFFVLSSGVIETGLFCNLVRKAYFGNTDGTVSVREF
ncbi:unnamed protein product [Notodromas monacha]|uniref:ribose-5-phosphate isomerase n=1 Tax=Notodromas monacha TaxID=399045 RepID=A0A7R9G9J4_9CRUS|nr:unnamed protein product [Notodromas monacha]CAG0914272.1 unnamed protein product [Notodromas monacha]